MTENPKKLSIQRRVYGFIKDGLIGRGNMRQDAKSRNDEGQFTEKVTDNDILHFFDSGELPFYSAQDVADGLAIDRSHAHRRLETLAAGGGLEKIETGKGSVVWWRRRDTVVLTREDCGPYTAIDTKTDIAGQGDTRANALRDLANAVDLAEEARKDDSIEGSVPDAPWFDNPDESVEEDSSDEAPVPEASGDD